MRRAALPFRSSEGFHPMPKMSLAGALGLGIIGREEVAEIEFEVALAAEEVHSRLAAQAPAGLQILSVRHIERRQTAQVCRVCYFLPLTPSDHPGLPERIADLLTRDECWVERAKPYRRQVNIRPYLRDIFVAEEGLNMDFSVTPQGTARPDEVLHLLALSRLMDDGAVLERTVVEIQDEEMGQRSAANEHLQAADVSLQLASGRQPLTANY